jgi:hypothetical protein
VSVLVLHYSEPITSLTSSHLHLQVHAVLEEVVHSLTLRTYIFCLFFLFFFLVFFYLFIYFLVLLLLLLLLLLSFLIYLFIYLFLFFCFFVIFLVYRGRDVDSERSKPAGSGWFFI